MQIEKIQTKIYEIRGLKVMLDFNLAELYEVENRALKQAVKRNIYRFPEDFMFQLTKTEWQEVITNCDNLPEGINSVRPLLLHLQNRVYQCFPVYLKAKRHCR